MEMIMEWSKPNLGILRYPEYPYVWLYQKLRFGGASNLSAADGINSVDIPVMIIHGTDDQVIAYDGASIMAHRDEITNPNVQFVTYEYPPQNGHTDLYVAKSALNYIEELEADWDMLEEEYGGEELIPEDVKKEWYEHLDREKASKRDEVFMQDVYKFFRDAVKK